MTFSFWSNRFMVHFVVLCLGVTAFFASPEKVCAVQHAWKPIFGNRQAMPPQLVMVDKDKQQIALYQGTTLPVLEKTYDCTTGRRIGDKKVQGDLKTPEGIYFVLNHINSGLDPFKYGPGAYTLNYPNPIDRLQKKTGYGIWIHGRGETIRPLLTEGCVALENSNLKELGRILTPGTPVALTSSFAYTNKILAEDATTAAHLVGQVQAWAKAWGNRSPTLFRFYNSGAYSVANEPFSRFQSQKERLFKQLPWIKTSVHSVQALKGPDYWVTWFYQNYTAPNLTTSGVRRLYWQQNAKGEYAIVGMEWIPNLTNETSLADIDPSPTSATEGLAEPVPNQDPLEQAEVLPTFQVANTLADEQLAKPTLALALYEKGDITITGGTLLAMNSAKTYGDTHSSSLTDATNQPTLLAMGTFGSKEKTLPAEQKTAPTEQQKTIAEAPPKVALDEKIKPNIQAEVVAEPPLAQPPSQKPVAFSETDKETLLNEIEKWRLAWAKGNLEDYLRFYAPAAHQGKLKGTKAISLQKGDLWKRRPPARIGLSKITFSQKGTTVQARMHQLYKDAHGAGDNGIKTLVFERFGDTWRITSETWSAR